MNGETDAVFFPSADEDIFRPLSGNTFRFNCHKALGCFTECCAKLRLMLTPYDILRIKNRLGISSDEFLDLFTETDLKSHVRFPMVRLKMQDNEKRSCPFVTKEGCRIYEDRPGACRLYPVGRAALIQGAGGENTVGDRFFLVTEHHCLGFEEDRHWTVEEWLNHEALRDYNMMNDKWLEILGSKQSLGPKEAVQKKVQMFYMASYNLDKFRNFVFQSRFFDMFHVDDGIRESLKSNDTTLLELAFDWLKFSLFNEKTMTLK